MITAPETDSLKRRELRGIRRLATALLGLMAVIWIAARLAPPDWPAAPFVAAFAEAGMVGAIADWFAVTALFRRPFGLPIPHTAIIPRNKDRIGEALGEFIAHNFLEPRVLDRKLRDAEPARRLADWLADPDRRASLARRAAAWAPDLIGAGPGLADLAIDGLRELARAGPVAPIAARALAFLWREAGAGALVDRILAGLARFLAERPELIVAAVEARTWTWTPEWFDRALAVRLSRGLTQTLEDMGERSHPLRQSLEAQIAGLIDRLEHDQGLIERIETLKDRLFDDPGLLSSFRQGVDEAARKLSEDPRALGKVVETLIVRCLGGVAAQLSADEGARDRLDLWIRLALRRGVAPGREAIGRFVAQVVAGWDARGVSDRLEAQVGRDLQFIRINGALVGALVGLAIYAVGRLIS
jgi:uncharacterized membrane-anchored protein YjiN (DUF445 family)